MKKYQIIYADPPWRYDFSQSKSRQIENQYPTMDTQEICSLNIPSEDNSVLYLWATAPKLLEALEVMKSWGYKYKSQAVWDKQMIGMGYWFRGQHEILLVGVKGKFSPPSIKKSSVFSFKRSKHSKKPPEIREYLSTAFTDKSKVELFARQKTEGWDVWGNEVESDVEFESTNTGT
jgi:site-specific DNA-methyltransferase (adenine-specific)